MSKINYKIGEANFSLVMKRIASILLLEFTEQINLGNTFLPSIVYFDTNFAADEGNIPFVSVNWSGLDNKTDSKGISLNTNKFFIDVKAVGYDVARQIISVIRTILKSQQYTRLDYDYGIVSETNVLNAGIDFEASLRDSQGVVSGGLTYECLILENNDESVPTPLTDSIYVSLINESNKSITLKQNY